MAARMAYPTPDKVEAADKVQLATWVRHLPSPGESATQPGVPFDTEAYDRAFHNECKVLETILARFRQMGGWDPEMSKAVGWS